MTSTECKSARSGEVWALEKRPSTTRTIRTGRRTIAVTQSDKVLFPEAGLTKGGLLEYYRRAGRAMLPHIRGRPLVAESFPNGTECPGFRWSAPPEWFPSWIGRQKVGRGLDAAAHLVCDHAPELLYLVEQGMVTPHVWSSRIDRPQHPDRMTFDLDPLANAGFDAVRDVADRVRRLLERLHLPSFPMTTGFRGIHIVVPLSRRESFDDVHCFAREVAEMAAAEAPDRIALGSESGQAPGPATARVGVGIDRNGFGRTAVTPYAVRGGSEALVATPFAWRELPRVEPRRFSVAGVLRRLGAGGDPWWNMKQMARSLHRARKPL